jgi:hypothetical protein
MIPMLDVICIYAIYTNKYLEKGISIIETIFKNENIVYKLLVVQNDISAEKVESKNYDYIFSDNKYNEFSAWNTGYIYLNDLDVRSKLLVFINDSFYRNYDIESLSYKFALKYYKKYFIYGHKDELKNCVKINGKKFQYWIRTNYFISNKKTIDKVIRLIKNVNIVNEITNTEDLIDVNNLYYEKDYLKFIESWLTKKEYPKRLLINEHWYQAAEFNNSNKIFLKKKVKSILLEHLLSYVCKYNNIRIVSTNDDSINTIINIFKKNMKKYL